MGRICGAQRWSFFAVVWVTNGQVGKPSHFERFWPIPRLSSYSKKCFVGKTLICQTWKDILRISSHEVFVVKSCLKPNSRTQILGQRENQLTETTRYNQEHCQMASQRSVPCVHSPPGRWPAEIHSVFLDGDGGSTGSSWVGADRPLAAMATRSAKSSQQTPSHGFVCRGVRDFTIIHMWYAGSQLPTKHVCHITWKVGCHTICWFNLCIQNIQTNIEGHVVHILRCFWNVGKADEFRSFLTEPRPERRKSAGVSSATTLGTPGGGLPYLCLPLPTTGCGPSFVFC